MKSLRLAQNASRKRGGTTRLVSLPAPIGGWNTAEGLAVTSPATAQVLENWRPTTTGCVPRAGSRTVATASLEGDPVETILTFNSALQQRLFAATETDIYDMTVVADPVVPPSPVVTGRTRGRYSYVNSTTSGDAYLLAVNGADPLLIYNPIDGWKPITDTSTPAITGIATSKLSFVWLYRNRVFFVERDTMKARFLGVGAISGALGTVDLNGVFQRGGSLLLGATWSLDAGDGLDDKCVFITTEGEVAVFEGSNPASSASSDWSMVGRYDIGRPLGPDATMRAGGDLLIATADGLVPISAAINKDIAALAQAAVSRPIAPDWQREANDRQGLPWQIQKWSEKSYALISLPVSRPGQEPGALVVNTVTGAWCRYTNWDIRCLGMHRNQLYFGTSDGRVKIAEVGGMDDGAGIYYTMVGNPEHLGAQGVVKTVRQGRATYRGSTPFLDKLTASVNYTVELPSPPDAAASIQTNNWDSGLWDRAKWDAASPPSVVRAGWVSFGVTGHVIQYQLQITGGSAGAPDLELVSIDLSFDLGSAIV